MIPLPQCHPIISCFIKIQNGFYLSGASLPRLSWKGALKLNWMFVFFNPFWSQKMPENTANVLIQMFFSYNNYWLVSELTTRGVLFVGKLTLPSRQNKKKHKG